MNGNKWYYQINDQKVGPLDFPGIIQLAEKGVITPRDMLFSEQDGNWFEAGKLPGIFKEQSNAKDTADDEGMEGLFEKITTLLFHPKEFFSAIKDNKDNFKKTFFKYFLLLLLLTAFISMGLAIISRFFTYSFLDTSYFKKMDFTKAISAFLLIQVFGMLFSTAAIYVLYLITNSLASTFSSVANKIDSYKLVVYSCTPLVLTGIFSCVIMISSLIWIAGLLFFIYIYYKGLPIMMETPREKRVSFTVVMAFISAVLMYSMYYYLSNFIAIRVVLPSYF